MEWTTATEVSSRGETVSIDWREASSRCESSQLSHWFKVTSYIPSSRRFCSSRSSFRSFFFLPLPSALFFLRQTFLLFSLWLFSWVNVNENVHSPSLLFVQLLSRHLSLLISSYFFLPVSSSCPKPTRDDMRTRRESETDALPLKEGALLLWERRTHGLLFDIKKTTTTQRRKGDERTRWLWQKSRKTAAPSASKLKTWNTGLPLFFSFLVVFFFSCSTCQLQSRDWFIECLLARALLSISPGN